MDWVAYSYDKKYFLEIVQNSYSSSFSECSSSTHNVDFKSLAKIEWFQFKTLIFYNCFAPNKLGQES